MIFSVRGEGGGGGGASVEHNSPKVVLDSRVCSSESFIFFFDFEHELIRINFPDPSNFFPVINLHALLVLHVIYKPRGSVSSSHPNTDKWSSDT